MKQILKIFFICAVAVFSAHNAVADVTVYDASKEEQGQNKIPVMAETNIEIKQNAPAATQQANPTERQENKIDYNTPATNEKNTYTHPVVEINSSELGSQPEIKTECDNEGNICLTSYLYADRIVLEAENRAPAIRTMNIKYSLNNMRPLNNSARTNIVLKSGERKKFETLVIIDVNYNYGYNYNYTSVFGVVDAVHDDSYVYDLPYDLNNKFILIQGIGGKFSHTNEENYYAYDFKMPIGTPVLAAREGVVVKVVDKYAEGGVDTSLKKKANYVYIQHSDGTIADYTHIKPNGSLVAVGDYVQKGQKIALSGNTGYTSNPHLHFGVLKVLKGGKYKSVPIRMKTSTGTPDALKAGEFYSK